MVTNNPDPESLESLTAEWQETLDALPPMVCRACKNELVLLDLAMIPYIGMIHIGCPADPIARGLILSTTRTNTV